MIDQGFNAMGKLIPMSRKLNALNFLLQTIKREHFNHKRFLLDVAECLEKDAPEQAMDIATTELDITGSYMLLAYLLTDPQGE